MRKIAFATVLVLAMFLIFSLGQKEVLSTNITPEHSNDKGDVLMKDIEIDIPVIAPPIIEEPVIKDTTPKVDLAYEEVLQFIAADNKPMVDNPDSVLVLVNKENNLSPSYVPGDLVIPNAPFSFAGEDQKKYLRNDAAMALEDLIGQAQEAGHQIHAVSGYRSYERQKSIFLGNVKKFGFKKTNTFSAVPGQSEHQTGLAMDVSCATVNYRLTESFAETPEGLWLKDNAHLFGFIIRYAKTKTEITGYQYEPWHIRYVGIEDATTIQMNDLTLEEYLLSKGRI